MEFRLDDGQLELQETVARFCADRFPLDALASREGAATDRATWSGLADLGLLGLLEAGSGLGVVEAAIAFELLGSHLAPGPVLWTVLSAPLVPGAGAGTQLVVGVDAGAMLDGSWGDNRWRQIPARIDSGATIELRMDEAPVSGPVGFRSAAASDVGLAREINEDAFIERPDAGVWAVADGLGGHRAGEVASATAIETLVDSFGAGQPVGLAVSDANAAVFAKAGTDLELQGMGTTLTVLTLPADAHAVLGHVGDSRAYLARDGALSRVTEDHSLVEQLVREGRLRPEEALHHPQRAIITRALGVDSQVEVDIYEIDVRPGDRVLLCSDGLTDLVDDEGIARTLSAALSADDACAQLVQLALDRGGRDNVTVVVAAYALSDQL